MDKRGEATRYKIVKAALDECYYFHYHMFTLRSLDTASGVAFAVIRYHFPTMKDLHDSMMALAIQEEHLQALAMGLACKNDIARRAPKKLKMKALRHLDWVG